MLLFLTIYFLLPQTLGTWSPALFFSFQVHGCRQSLCRGSTRLSSPQNSRSSQSLLATHSATDCAKGFTWRCPWTSQHASRHERALLRGVQQKIRNHGACWGPEANDTPRLPCPGGARFLASSLWVHQSQVSGPVLWTNSSAPCGPRGSIPAIRGLGHF